MDIKKVIWTITFILLASISYADYWTAGSEFTPTESNATYILNNNIIVINLTTNETCLTLFFESTTEQYCNIYSSPTNITLNFVDIYANATYSYGTTYSLTNFTADITDGNNTYNYYTTMGIITIPNNALNSLDPLIDITINSTEDGGFLSREYLQQNKLNPLYSNIWQSELHVNVLEAVSENFIESSTVNLDFNSNILSNLTNGYITYFLDTGNYNVNATHPFFIDSNNTNGTLTNQQIKEINISLSSSFNISFLREQTGLPFNFIEDEIPYDCYNTTINQTNFLLQEDSDLNTCIGTFDPNNPCSYGYDNIDFTYAKSNSSEITYLIQRWSKPLDVNNNTKIRLQKDLYTYKNYTIPTNCYSQNPIITNSSSDITNNQMNLSCYNGTGYELIDSISNGGHINDLNLYWAKDEEVPDITTCQNETQVDFIIDIFCPTKKVTNVINNSNQGIIGVDCNYDYWLVTAQYSTTSYYRTVIPDKSIQDYDIYLLDLNVDDAIEVIIKVEDLSGEYIDGKIKLSTFINGTEQTVITQILDIENKVTLWLDKGQTYKIYAIESDGTENFVGDLLADQATTKTLTIPTIPLTYNGRYLGTEVYWVYSANKDTGEAMLYYFDVSESGYNSLTWQIYDDTAKTFIYNTTVTTGFNTTLNVSGLDSHTSYISILNIDHKESNDNIIEVRPLWTGSATVFEGWGETITGPDGHPYNKTSEQFKLVFATLITIFFIIIFSQGTIEVGMTAGLIVMYIFNGYGWYDLIPYWKLVQYPILSIFSILTIGRFIQKVKNK